MLALLGSPGAAQDSLAGLGPVRGYTDAPLDTTRERYDILVDASRPDDPERRRFRTVQAAYAAAPAGTQDRPTVIGLLPDVYLLNGTATTPGLQVTKANITLLGLTRDRRAVVLADNRGNKQGAANNGFTMTVDADGFSARNLTILNYCNLDYDYPGAPSKSLRRRSNVITQAVAIQMRGDRHSYSHVAFLSRLDTMFNGTKRSYFSHSYLEGTDDYLGAPGASVWKDSEINFIEGGGILFAGGTTFIRTRFRATKPMQFYKVPVAPVALIESTLPDVPVAWFGWRAPAATPEPSLTWRTTTVSGRRPDITDSVVGAPRRTIGRELTDAEARAFNPWNMLRWTADGTDDGWDPAGVRAVHANEPPLPYRLRLDTAAARLRTGEAKGATVDVAATAFPPGSAGRIHWSAASPLVRLSAVQGARVTVTAANTTDRPVVVPVEARTDNGLVARATVTVDPPYRPAPTFTAAPALAVRGGRARLSYRLAGLDSQADRSRVTWFTCDDPACTNSEVIAVSRGDAPLLELELSTALVGRTLVAEVAPKHGLSLPGPARRTPGLRVASASPAAAVSLDVHHLPDAATPRRWAGDWRLDGGWTSEPPAEGAESWGLRAGREDATLLYVAGRQVRDMDVTVVLDPDKLEGQGFSIAGTPDDEGRPRADILFRYDTATRTGYSVRFWRSTRSATAVVFQLYRIADGRGTPLGPPDQLTGVLKPTTTFRVAVRGTGVTVDAANTTDRELLHLAGTIAPLGAGGAGLYWTGAGPGGSVVLRRFTIAYPSPR